jgi:hypothetical protein
MELDRQAFTGVAGSNQHIICLAVTLMSACWLGHEDR